MSTTILATWKEPGEVAIQAAWGAMQQSGSMTDALEAGLAAAELDPDLILVGIGSLLNTDGELELDAAMMRGSDLLCGAVCAVRGIAPVISVARKVMEHTPHIMIAGDQARRYAIQQGFEPRSTITVDALKAYEKWRENPQRIRQYVHAITDTVTMLGSQDGKLMAASSTSGMPYKMPGRVGDSPIFGAGLYADDECGAAGATGNGEELWKGCVSIRAVDKMREGATPQEACDEVVKLLLRRQEKVSELPCCVFALSPSGEFGAATTQGEFPIWVCQDGEMQLRVFGEAHS